MACSEVSLDTKLLFMPLSSMFPKGNICAYSNAVFVSIRNLNQSDLVDSVLLVLIPCFICGKSIM